MGHKGTLESKENWEKAESILFFLPLRQEVLPQDSTMWSPMNFQLRDSSTSRAGAWSGPPRSPSAGPALIMETASSLTLEMSGHSVKYKIATCLQRDG